MLKLIPYFFFTVFRSEWKKSLEYALIFCCVDAAVFFNMWIWRSQDGWTNLGWLRGDTSQDEQMNATKKQNKIDFVWTEALLPLSKWNLATK